MNDYSEYLKQPGMLDYIESEWKAKPEGHDRHAEVVNRFIKENNITDMIEIGCGTGELASRLKVGRYMGYDSNPDCVAIASDKNTEKGFGCIDVRDLTGVPRSLVISFGFLKHFGLHEWADIFKRVAYFGDYFIFDMPIAEETKDDGLDYHHVWMRPMDINWQLARSGLEVVAIEPNGVEPIYICRHV